MNYLAIPRYSINKRGGKRQTSSKQTQAIIQIKENSVMSNLFTAVSVEQQEIVAGGTLPLGPTALFATAFKGAQTVQKGASISNWNGSSAGGEQYTQRVKSLGISFLKA
ncbi:MAG: CTB family bacteriocin [Cuspidothrix sp.]